MRERAKGGSLWWEILARAKILALFPSFSLLFFPAFFYQTFFSPRLSRCLKISTERVEHFPPQNSPSSLALLFFLISNLLASLLYKVQIGGKKLAFTWFGKGRLFYEIEKIGWIIRYIVYCFKLKIFKLYYKKGFI